MSQNEIINEDGLQDPTASLQDAKLEIQQKITHAKLLLKQRQKELRGIEKLDIEVVTDKNERKLEKTREIQTLLDTITELEFDEKSLNRSREDQNEEMIQAALFKVAEFLRKDNSMAYIIERGDFVYVDNYSVTPEKPNVLFRNMSL